MRRIFWISLDLLEDLIRKPGLVAAAIGVIVLIPLQTGIVGGLLLKLGGPLDHGIHRLLTTSGLCPAMSAVMLYSGIVFPRFLTHELEPILSAPVTDREIAFGYVLPFLALAVAGSIPASASTLVGFAILAGAPPRNAITEGLDLVLAVQVSNAWVACALIRSSRRLARPDFTVWNVSLVFLVLVMLDAVTVTWLSREGPLGRRALLSGALLAAAPVAWWFSRRIDREALIR